MGIKLAKCRLDGEWYLLFMFQPSSSTAAKHTAATTVQPTQEVTLTQCSPSVCRFGRGASVSDGLSKYAAVSSISPRPLLEEELLGTVIKCVG